MTLWYCGVDAQHLGFSDVGDAVTVVVDPPRGLVVCGFAALILVKVEAVCEITWRITICSELTLGNSTLTGEKISSMEKKCIDNENRIKPYVNSIVNRSTTRNHIYPEFMADPEWRSLVLGMGEILQIFTTLANSQIFFFIRFNRV